MVKKILWMRLGDQGDYEHYSTPLDAGWEVGNYYQAIGRKKLEIHRVSKGVSIAPGFVGDNYISLYWGDKDAQPIKNAELTKSEFSAFTQGIYEGATG